MASRFQVAVHVLDIRGAGHHQDEVVGMTEVITDTVLRQPTFLARVLHHRQLEQAGNNQASPAATSGWPGA